MMNFRSDNEAGAHPLIIAAVGRAFASGSPAAFGEDEWTRRVEQRFREVFDKPDLLAFPVITGTVANALSLACCAPPWGAVYCHPTAHIGVDEANALQFYTSGAKLCLISKMQLLSAQLDAYLTDGLWLANARHANAMARRLASGLTSLTGTQLLYPVDANEIFVVLPEQMHDALRAAGAHYHPWPYSMGEGVFRLVTAFDTDPAEVDRFLTIAKTA